MKTQKEQIRILLENKQIEDALRIALKSCYTKGNLDKIKMAYEMILYPNFYRQLKLDIEKGINDGVNELILNY